MTNEEKLVKEVCLKSTKWVAQLLEATVHSATCGN